MSIVVLDTEKINDPIVRECMEKLSEVLNSGTFTSGKFKIYELKVTNTTSTIKFPHGLNFIPSDVWVSWVSPTSTIVIQYDQIDEKHIYFTSSSTCKLRIVAGRPANG